MRWSRIFYITGYLLVCIGLCMALPLGVSLYFGETGAWPFVYAMAVTVSCGALLIAGCRAGRGEMISHREDMSIKTLWRVYLLISAVLVLLLKIGDMSLFDAVCHTFTTMPTGGFSTQNLSIAAYNNAYLDWVLVVVSILTTTGFATADYETWPALSLLILFVCMFVGASAGSTGGGMKCIRIYVLIFIACSFLLAAMGVDAVTSAAAVAASIGNIGPGFGAVGPLDNYAQIPVAGKWRLMWCMLLGRLEIYTILILLVPEFWRK